MPIDPLLDDPKLLSLLAQFQAEDKFSSSGGFFGAQQSRGFFGTQDAPLGGGFFGGRQRSQGVQDLLSLSVPYYTANRLSRYKSQGLDDFTAFNNVGRDLQDLEERTGVLAKQQTRGFLPRVIDEFTAPFKTVGRFIKELDDPPENKTVTPMQFLGASAEIFLTIFPPVKYARIVAGLSRAAKAALTAGQVYGVAQKAKEAASLGLVLGAAQGAAASIRRGDTDLSSIARQSISSAAWGAGLMGVMPSIGAVFKKFRQLNGPLAQYIADPDLIDALDISKEAKAAAKAALQSDDLANLFAGETSGFKAASVNLYKRFAASLRNVDAFTNLPEEFKARALIRARPGLEHIITPAGEALEHGGAYGKEVVRRINEAKTYIRESTNRIWTENWMGRFVPKAETLLMRAFKKEPVPTGIPPELEPLAREARKYKSVKDFSKATGFIQKWGTLNPWYARNPYRQELSRMAKTGQFDDDIIQKADRWEMQQVLKDKPAYLSDGSLSPVEIKKFAEKYGLAFGYAADYAPIVAKNEQILESVKNAIKTPGGQKQLGKALGYIEVGPDFYRQATQGAGRIAARTSRTVAGLTGYTPELLADYTNAQNSAYFKRLFGEAADNEIKRYMSVLGYEDSQWLPIHQTSKRSTQAIIDEYRGAGIEDLPDIDPATFNPTRRIIPDDIIVRVYRDQAFRNKLSQHLIDTGQVDRYIAERLKLTVKNVIDKSDDELVGFAKNLGIKIKPTEGVRKQFAKALIKDWADHSRWIPGPGDVPKSHFFFGQGPDLDFGDLIPKQDLETAWGIATHSAMRHVAFAKQFGPRREIFNGLFEKIQQEASHPMAEHARRLVDEEFGILNPKALPTDFYNKVRSVNAITLLGPLTTLAQTSQLINAAVMSGVWPTIKTMAMHLINPQARSIAYPRSAFQNLISDIYFKAEQNFKSGLAHAPGAVMGEAERGVGLLAAGPLTRMAQKYFRFIQLPQTDGFFRGVAGDLAGNEVREMYKLAGRRVLTEAEKHSLKTRFGLSPDDFMRAAQEGKTIPKEWVERSMQRGADFTNITYDAVNQPMFSFSPTGALLFQFKRFAFGFTYSMLRGVWQEAVHGNWKPMMRALALYGGTAGVYDKARDLLWRREDTMKKDADFWVDTMDKMIAAGSLGIFGELIRADRYGLLGFVGGPAATTANEAYNAVRDLFEGDPDKGIAERSEKMRRFIARRTPLFGPAVVAFNKELIDDRLLNPTSLRGWYQEIINEEFGDQVALLQTVEITDEVAERLFNAFNGDPTIAQVSATAIKHRLNAKKEFKQALRSLKAGLSRDDTGEATYLLDLLSKVDSPDEIPEIVSKFSPAVQRKAAILAFNLAMDEVSLIEQEKQFAGL